MRNPEKECKQISKGRLGPLDTHGGEDTFREALQLHLGSAERLQHDLQNHTRRSPVLCKQAVPRERDRARTAPRPRSCWTAKLYSGHVWHGVLTGRGQREGTAGLVTLGPCFHGNGNPPGQVQGSSDSRPFLTLPSRSS